MGWPSSSYEQFTGAPRDSAEEDRWDRASGLKEHLQNVHDVDTSDVDHRDDDALERLHSMHNELPRRAHFKMGQTD